jgi:erythromycin esterase-like protein
MSALAEAVRPLSRPASHDPVVERAIGVIYMPQTERRSHDFEASISRQFDAVIHLDERAAETYPWAV